MKKNILYLLIVFFSIFLTRNIYSQRESSTSMVGTTAAQFLKIGAGARAIAMGGAYTAISNDIYAVYYNPGGLAMAADPTQITFDHANWLANISYDFAAASINVPGLGVLFASLTSLTTPQDKVRTFEFPHGDGRYWNASSLAIGVGFSRALTDKFSIGLQFKYVRDAIWNMSANGFAIDVGTYYITPFNNLVIGASISNFGSKMKLSGRELLFNYDPNGNPNTGPNNVLSQYYMDSYDMPLTFRIGLGMNLVKSRYIRVTGDIDAIHPNDNTEYMNSGLEFAFNEMFFIRAGYKTLFMRNSVGGLTLGAGINYKFNKNLTFTLNYAWANYGRLNSVQFMDIGLML